MNVPTPTPTLTVQIPTVRAYSLHTVGDTLRYRLPSNDMDDRETKQKKSIDTENPVLFICRKFEEGYEKIFCDRKIYYKTSPSIGGLTSKECLRGLSDNQKWPNLFRIKIVRPKLVRMFYANLWITENNSSEPWARSCVNGYEISLTSHDVNRHFGLVDEGFKVSSATKMSKEEFKLTVQTVEDYWGKIHLAALEKTRRKYEDRKRKSTMNSSTNEDDGPTVECEFQVSQSSRVY
ncbi:hypothetical protein M9H77_17128 [Catharanthus roseus]|uniref:Uncharacterized protein n=1 Tax=Catharanthus roseus TaxID=4058 RepID=A0ACC0B3R4_CATRO|nr:hypothetical protein M9H77_17128 [Catharanthus roseus]